MRNDAKLLNPNDQNLNNIYMSMIDNTNSLLSVPTGSLAIPQDTCKTALLLSLIIPTYQESENIQSIIKILTQIFDDSIPGEYELIVVDDDSPDDTWKLAQSLMPKYPQLQVMRRQSERGLSSAVIRGWQMARGDILGVIDGDLQHPPHIILRMLEAMKKNADLVVASRHVDGGGVSSWSFMRRFLSRGAQLLGLIILPEILGRVSDPMSGYFMVRRSCVAGTTLNPVGYKILLEVVGRGNVGKIAEVGYVFCERKQGASKV